MDSEGIKKQQYGSVNDVTEQLFFGGEEENNDISERYDKSFESSGIGKKIGELTEPRMEDQVAIAMPPGVEEGENVDVKMKTENIEVDREGKISHEGVEKIKRIIGELENDPASLNAKIDEMSKEIRKTT